MHCNQKISEGNYNEATVNLLRTSLKRIKSLWQFASYFSEYREKKFDNSCIKKLFKSAAVLRDYQVAEKIILRKRKGENYRDFLSDLRAKQEIGKRILQNGIKEFNFKDLDFVFSSLLSVLKYDTTVHLENKIQDLFYTKIRILSEHLEQCCDNESFHKARIKVKELIFFMEIFDEKSEKISPLPKMGMKMGRWHDRVILLEKINEFLEKSVNNLPENYTQTAKKLYSENSRKMKELKCELVEILKRNPK